MGTSEVLGISTSSLVAIDTANTNTRRLLTATLSKDGDTQNQTVSTPSSSVVQLSESAAATTTEQTDKSDKPDQTVQSKQLSKADAAQLAKLQARDRQVRLHEMAHLAASGGLATSGPSFTYQKGPDGVNYAVGGEVSIDTSPGRTPEDTIARARQIQAAALAPADPSGQDRAVAAQAQHMEIEARSVLASQASSSTPAESASSAGPKDSSSTKDTAQQKLDQVQQAYSISAVSSIINVYA